ncbi:MAG: hypothetical protein CMP56_03675 [Flavobacteriales bacterium]|nr:hypothetical protein [Flavobacteriales bacterium]
MHRLVFLFCFISFFSASQNYFNDGGERMGWWYGYHDNGIIKYEGKFYNGKEIGEFKYYDTSGNMVINLNYIDTGVTSVARLYSSDGLQKATGKYVNKRKEGSWFYYNNLAQIYLKEQYQDGELNGDVVYYFNDFLVSEKYKYINNLKHGIGEIFYQSGMINMRSNYKNGKLDGLSESYYNEQSTGFDNILDYQEGYYNKKDLLKLESKGMYNMGFRDSTWIYFSERGDILKVVKYDNGYILIDD